MCAANFLEAFGSLCMWPDCSPRLWSGGRPLGAPLSFDVVKNAGAGLRLALGLFRGLADLFGSRDLCSPCHLAAHADH